MKHKSIYGDFYDPTKLMSYKDKSWFIALGVRSVGKTTGFMIYLVLQYLKHGKQFIYLRRTLDELKETAPTAIQQAVIIINNYYKKPLIESWEYKNGKYYINGELAGHAVPLSLERKYKSIDFSKVAFIIYDEFLVKSGRYLGNKDQPFYECDCLDSLYATVDRGIGVAFRNETKVIFLGNNMSGYYNPIFIKLGIDKYIKLNDKYLSPKGTKWVVEQILGVKATEDYKNSNVYQLASVKTREYAFLGGSDDSTFVEKAKGRLTGLYNLIYKGDHFGIYLDNGDMKLFVSTREIKDDVRTFALTAADHSPNYRLMQNNRPELQILKDFYYKGDIKFQNGKCKFAINSYFAFDI